MSGCRHEADWEPLAEVGEDGLLTGDTSIRCKACGEWFFAPCLCAIPCTLEQRRANRMRGRSTASGLNIHASRPH